MGTMRAARLESSLRLQAAFWLLADGQRHSNWEIIQTCKIAAVNSVVAELKDKKRTDNDLSIRHKYEDGGHWYTMELNARFYSWRRRLMGQRSAGG